MDFNMKNKEEVIKKINKLNTFENLPKTAYYLSADIAAFLSDEIDELNVYSHVFRSGMEKCFLRVLDSLVKQEQPVVIFPDSIPGFTMMVLKRNNLKKDKSEIKSDESTQSVEVFKESKVVDSVISKFFEKNQQKVLLIENKDLMFIMLPVSDAKKQLQEMDLYITFN